MVCEDFIVPGVEHATTECKSCRADYTLSEKITESMWRFTTSKHSFFFLIIHV